ncbi:hypothetical protein ACHAXR_002691 [Thalassiosira sp. AJA248-18]
MKLPQLAVLISSAAAFTLTPPSSSRRRIGLSPFSSFRGPLVPIIDHHQNRVSKRSPRVAIAASSSQLQQGGTSSNDSSTTSSKRNSLRRTIFLHVWVIFTSAFVITNAKVRPFPQFLLSALSRSQWALIHAICSMLFSGTIILSALIEYLVVASKKASVIKFWFLSVPQKLDASIVLPALTGSIVSGVGQAAIDYGGLAQAPKHIVGAFHLLLTFGVWWGVTDITSQRKAVEAVQTLNEAGKSDDDSENNDTVEVPKLLKMRVISNVVSCIFVVGMYALMVLKPGFGK